MMSGNEGASSGASRHWRHAVEHLAAGIGPKRRGERGGCRCRPAAGRLHDPGTGTAAVQRQAARSHRVRRRGRTPRDHRSGCVVPPRAARRTNGPCSDSSHRVTGRLAPQVLTGLRTGISEPGEPGRTGSRKGPEPPGDQDGIVLDCRDCSRPEYAVRLLRRRRVSRSPRCSRSRSASAPTPRSSRSSTA